MAKFTSMVVCGSVAGLIVASHGCGFPEYEFVGDGSAADSGSNRGDARRDVTVTPDGTSDAVVSDATVSEASDGTVDSGDVSLAETLATPDAAEIGVDRPMLADGASDADALPPMDVRPDTTSDADAVPFMDVRPDILADAEVAIDVGRDADAGRDVAVDVADVAQVCDPLIDNMEGPTQFSRNVCGRGGPWYTYKDTAAAISPAPGALVVSTSAAAVGGTSMARDVYGRTGAAGYGAGLGLDLRPASALYNASAYAGIRFRARLGASATSPAFVRVNLPNVQSVAAGGCCKDHCGAHWGKDIQITSTWTEYSIRFSDPDFTAPIWGECGTTFDSTAVYSIVFQFEPLAGADRAFDLWLDDLSFIAP